MSSENKKIIYGNGEHYIEPIKKGSGWGEPFYLRTYDEARELVIDRIKSTQQTVSSLEKENYLEEAVVFCLRLNENFVAKSYHPERLIEEAPIEFIGSQKWNPSKHKDSKLLFVRMHEKSFPQFLSLFDRSTNSLTKEWVSDVRKIEDISLLSTEEKIIGFDDWSKGRIELVLHPLTTHSDVALSKTFSKLKKLGLSSSSIRYAQYERGLTFLSAELSKADTLKLGELNVIRSVHPLGDIHFPQFRVSKKQDAPQPPASQKPSPIKVGVFDGGTDPLNPLLLNHVVEHSLTKQSPISKGLSHGSAVAGCVLYGPLNPYQPKAVLPVPSVSVESYRVFPTSDPNDPELYEIIDNVEKIVSQRPDIKVYNLSFGPMGPIVDNHIRRFTYALDRLAFKHNVLFLVAVGNDGNDGPLAGRIQSPADGINVTGVGAHTYEISNKTGKFTNKETSYTCFGPGREGCKVKPDISSFGGCDNHPIALISPTAGHLAYSQGTSFASPIAAGSAAELMGRCSQLNPLLTRILMINRSSINSVEPHIQLGHGILLERPDEILECTSNRVTILYNGTLTTKKYAKIQIPFLKGPLTGKVNLRWTIGVLTKPDIENVDEYSTVCIEDTFYPHAEKFKFHQHDPSNKKKILSTRQLDLLTQKVEAEKLLAAGWTKNKYPISKVGVGYKAPEKTRRGLLKWDTIVDRKTSMMANGIHDPYLIVHAMSRNEYLDEFSEVNYGIAVTIEFPKFKGDLYAEIGKIYSKLSPLSVKSVNQLLLQT